MNDQHDKPKASGSAQSMQPDDLHDLFATPANFDPNDEEDPLAL